MAVTLLMACTYTAEGPHRGVMLTSDRYPQGYYSSHAAGGILFVVCDVPYTKPRHRVISVDNRTSPDCPPVRSQYQLRRRHSGQDIQS
jgi:hypothetical protein